MSNAQLDLLAERHGIALTYNGPDGSLVSVPEATKRQILTALGVDVSGDVEIADALASTPAGEMPTLQAAAGAHCFVPEWLESDKAWGIAVQLYEIRSARNWGIGDFADLADFARIAARAGADYIGVNPLHALFLAEAERCSPFSPSNRLFLNPLYIAVDRLPFFDASSADEAMLARLRAETLVDYKAVAALKLAALETAFRAWRAAADSPDHAKGAFDDFRAQGGEALRRHALFDALSLHMTREGYGSGWEEWPAEYRDAASTAVREFASRHEDGIAFHCWLQWIASRQLEDAAQAGRDAGLRIGLYVDCAVGEAPDGSATWSDPALSIASLSIGAPPDYFTADGQNWGLAPLSPAALKAAGLKPFRDMIAAALRHAGAMRIDHVMSLWQLFFVPRGGKPADGAYVRYPIDGLLRVVAEESQKRGAVVIGEDLGYVPEGFRPVMHEAGILSYRILYFEQNEAGFLPPHDYPRLAMACLATHDLPTFIGWWRGDDVSLRLDHDLIEADAAEHQTRERAFSRTALVQALRQNELIDDGDLAEIEAGLENPRSDPPPALTAAAHRFVARSQSLLATVRLADLTGETEPTNLPGTVDTYPNWRTKISVELDQIADATLFRSVIRAMAEERPQRR